MQSNTAQSCYSSTLPNVSHKTDKTIRLQIKDLSMWSYRDAKSDDEIYALLTNHRDAQEPDIPKWWNQLS